MTIRPKTTVVLSLIGYSKTGTGYWPAVTGCQSVYDYDDTLLEHIPNIYRCFLPHHWFHSRRCSGRWTFGCTFWSLPSVLWGTFTRTFLSMFERLSCIRLAATSWQPRKPISLGHSQRCRLPLTWWLGVLLCLDTSETRESLFREPHSGWIAKSRPHWDGGFDKHNAIYLPISSEIGQTLIWPPWFLGM